VPPDIIPSPRLPSPHTTGVQVLDASPRRCSFDPRSTASTTGNFPPVDDATCTQLAPLSPTTLSPPVTMLWLTLRPFKCMLSFEDRTYVPTDATISLDDIPRSYRVSSVTFSPTFPILAVSSTFDNVDIITRKTRAYL
jgi:hypothetical protein